MRLVLLGLAAVGIFVPVLPTTPFVIASAACFSIGNPEMCRRLETNYVFGPYIEGWRTKQGDYRPQKAAAITTLWLLLALSVYIVQSYGLQSFWQ